MTHLIQGDCLEHLPTIQDASVDLIFTDPPYQLGSKIVVDANGKLQYKGKAVDFMQKWDGLTGQNWEDFFRESFRVLKHGGFCIMYCLGRQSVVQQYYAILAGFEVCEPLFWYQIQSFPKSVDVGKMLDKHFGLEREKVGVKKHARDGDVSHQAWSKSKTNNLYLGINDNEKGFDITAPASDLAKFFNGYKYSQCPLKQAVETILIFKKPCKTGSVLNDVLAWADGDTSIHPALWNIDGSRVDLVNIEHHKTHAKGNSKFFGLKGENEPIESENPRYNDSGRHPSNLFVNPLAAQILDGQGDKTQGSGKKANPKYKSEGLFGSMIQGDMYDDFGGISKILHTCAYEAGDFDYLFYEPKVDPAEREFGVTGEKIICEIYGDFADKKKPKNANFHPTVKPISLNYRVLQLFKLPDNVPQTILIPFSGSGSELIAAQMHGFTDVTGIELSPEFAEISRQRLEAWKDKQPYYKPPVAENTDIEGQLTLF